MELSRKDLMEPMAVIFQMICVTSGQKNISATLTLRKTRKKEEKFVPKPYIGKTSMTKAKSKKAAEKKVPEKKEPEKKPEPEVKKDVPEGQMSLLDLAMPKSA